MAEFSYGFNIKRDRRTAGGFFAASAERTLVRLSQFTGGNNIKTGIVAYVSSLEDENGVRIITPAAYADENERVISAAHKILKDTYGIVNSFVVSSEDIAFTSAVAEVLKAYNKNIKFIAAVKDAEEIPDPDGIIDSVITVSESEAQSAKRSAEKTENVIISDEDSYTLFAAAKTAKETANKRRNVVFMLSDARRLAPVVNEEPEPVENEESGETKPESETENG